LSLTAFLSARNDVLVNLAIIAMAVVTPTETSWPDLILGSFIVVLALHAAYRVWTVSERKDWPPRHWPANRSADTTTGIPVRPTTRMRENSPRA
jgi:Co/Zn/Cd efflux system component